MRAIRIIFRRELGAYARSWFSWILAGIFLLVTGLMFQAYAYDKSLSAFVLERYFMYAGGSSIGLGILLSFRLISEERQTHSMVLLTTAPVRDRDIVLGKFFAALVFLALLVALSLYIPLMLKVGNKISLSQILVGYLGMIFLGGAALAIGLFASSLTRFQLVAGVVALVITIVLCVLYPFGKKLEGAGRILGDLDLWWVHYQASFMRGILNLADVIYYVAVIYFFLLLSVKTLEAKRWQ